MRVLVVDVGGTNVKILVTGRKKPRKVPSGRTLTPAKMVAAVKGLAPDWKYDAHLSFRNGVYEDYLGVRALKRLGRKKWQKYVEFGAARMIEAVHPDDVVLGGGNAKKLTKLPAGCRVGANANAFTGGFRLWAAAPSRA
jgi:predicted NBD/HSP70 family sugar kinase